MKEDSYLLASFPPAKYKWPLRLQAAWDPGPRLRNFSLLTPFFTYCLHPPSLPLAFKHANSLPPLKPFSTGVSALSPFKDNTSWKDHHLLPSPTSHSLLNPLESSLCLTVPPNSHAEVPMRSVWLDLVNNSQSSTYWASQHTSTHSASLSLSREILTSQVPTLLASNLPGAPSFPVSLVGASLSNKSGYLGIFSRFKPRPSSSLYNILRGDWSYLFSVLH